MPVNQHNVPITGHDDDNHHDMFNGDNVLPRIDFFRKAIGQFLTSGMLSPSDNTSDNPPENRNIVDNPDPLTNEAFMATFFSQDIEPQDRAIMAQILKAIEDRRETLDFLIPHSFFYGEKRLRIDLALHVTRLVQKNLINNKADKPFGWSDIFQDVYYHKLQISFIPPDWCSLWQRRTILFSLSALYVLFLVLCIRPLSVCDLGIQDGWLSSQYYRQPNITQIIPCVNGIPEIPGNISVNATDLAQWCKFAKSGIVATMKTLFSPDVWSQLNNGDLWGRWYLCSPASERRGMFYSVAMMVSLIFCVAGSLIVIWYVANLCQPCVDFFTRCNCKSSEEVMNAYINNPLPQTDRQYSEAVQQNNTITTAFFSSRTREYFDSFAKRWGAVNPDTEQPNDESTPLLHSRVQ